ncbi:hypothetical protein [Polaribacter vadi]|uniref:tetratricopeptide repeat protein n=1 Tax=Polaribacter vadi TaxID=1774273 RepID=UPI0030ED9267|tara:strand:- start:2143 stop:3285 length:1143 start_codon:yes stop_codon:yes gene_type:complete
MKKIAYLLLFVISFSCVKEKEKTKITLEEVTNLGFSLQNKSDRDDISAMNELYDVKAFADIFLLKSTDKEIHEFNAGFFNGFSRSFNFGEMLVEQKSEGGSYEFIRAYEDEKNNFHLLFRLYGEGLNYHDYLVKEINGELKIVDMYIYMSGEYLSDTYKTYYKSILDKSNVLTKDLTGITSYQDALKLIEVKELSAAGKFKEAHKVYKTISSSSKITKAFQLVNIMVTFNLSEDIYYKAIKDYEKRFPNDPSLYLVSLDGLILNKQFDKAIKSIDKLDELLGGDPFLNYIKGNIYYFEKDYESALGKYAIINLEYPDFIDAYDSALGIYLETNNHEKVIEILELYVTRFEIDKEELKFNLSEFSPAFIKTKEFKNWFSKK